MRRLLNRLFRVPVIDADHPPKGVGWFRVDTDTEHGWGRYDGMFAQWKPDTEQWE